MAKKEEPVSMVDTFAEFKELKNIEITTMISVLEESFRNVLAKIFGTDENFDIIVNPTSYLELAPNAGFEDSRFAKRCHLQ